jgi:hypothetical protein
MSDSVSICVDDIRCGAVHPLPPSILRKVSNSETLGLDQEFRVRRMNASLGASKGRFVKLRATI